MNPASLGRGASYQASNVPDRIETPARAGWARGLGDWEHPMNSPHNLAQPGVVTGSRTGESGRRAEWVRSTPITGPIWQR
jgi:hypothetical protein